MACRHIKHAGKYARGRWADDNELVDVSEEEQTGWGIKLDLMFGWTIRPIPYFWKLAFFKNDPIIRDIPDHELDEFFGEEQANKMRKLFELRDGYTKKYGAYNPWYGKYLFVMRIPRWIPTLFFSFNTPWKSLYIGNKAYRIDPFENDMSWTNKVDEDRADDLLPEDLYYALCPSISLRSHR
jgi:hypothetical protein